MSKYHNLVLNNPGLGSEQERVKTLAKLKHIYLLVSLNIQLEMRGGPVGYHSLTPRPRFDPWQALSPACASGFAPLHVKAVLSRACASNSKWPGPLSCNQCLKRPTRSGSSPSQPSRMGLGEVGQVRVFSFFLPSI